MTSKTIAFALLLLAAVSAVAQHKIVIPAGTPEDQALQAISNQSDAKQKIAMLEEFVTTYAANAPAAAYGNWQLAQQYAATGDMAKALAAGDRALAAAPDMLEILVTQADVAQQLKANSKVVDYATRGAVVYHAYPAEAQTGDAKNSYEYLETLGYNALAAETDPKQRLQETERYLSTFNNGRFAQQSAAVAIMAFQELKDAAGLAAFGDKVLESSPNDLRLITILANAYVSDPSGTQLVKAGTFARKAIELQAKGGDDPQTRNLAGIAHSVLGQVLLRGNKFAPAAAELKTATTLLKGSAQDEAGALYFLGFAYAKMERPAEAVSALTQATKLDTPYKAPAEELLSKIQTARKRR